MTCLFWTFAFAFSLCGVQADQSYSYQSTVPNSQSDVCQWEVFGGRCQNNEVIVLDRAEYGLLGHGRCYVATDDSCSSNVLGPADLLCSGQPQCEVRIPNSNFDSTNECLKLLRGSFRSSYSCLPVVPSSICSSSPIRLTASRSGTTLSGFHLRQSPCNGAFRSLSITVTSKPGQQINVTFVDFAWDIRNVMPEAQSLPACIIYGSVKDLQTGRTEQICGGQRRKHEVMLSLGNQLQLTLQPISDNRPFAIMFKAMGCADITPPLNAWMNRSDDSVTVGCQNSAQSWTLRCHEGQWIGRPVGNCSQTVTSFQEGPPVAWQPLVLPDSIVIALIAAVAFLICVGITTLGAVCYKRAQVKQEYYQGTLELMHYNTGKRSIRYTGTPPGRPRPAPVPAVPESPYYSAANFPYSLARRHSEGHPPNPPHERTYESLHILDRPIPEEQELGEAEPLNGPNIHQTRTLPLPRNRRVDDYYAPPVASTSQPEKDPKYYVLDKNFIRATGNIQLEDD
ncbi:hypothetical protein CAPTEDRAFT_224073 [Capitella teleta]|uniref:SUEL-type lectin domain-containing protein n=1 Tax=Capitella teleta TaxID=283909 RepID=R7U7C5_CAPTE|nr:hypothetical protein CAPTEDRAFT_224073 [Capitella teleta]|eukprot:ELT99576.1 hypothetical protein CAPTEDRAFT_224073 [Capitella teleta]